MSTNRNIYGPTPIAPKQEIPDGHELVVTLGDLHGNPMVLMETLIHYGLAVPVDEKAHEDLGNAYLDFLHQLNDEDQLTYDSSTFIKCLHRFKFRNTNQYGQPIAIRLIGDMLADRGNNDYFMLLVLLGMNDGKIPFSVNLSNHDMGFLEAYYLNLYKFKFANQAYPEALVTNVEYLDLKELVKQKGVDEDILNAALELNYTFPSIKGRELNEDDDDDDEFLLERIKDWIEPFKSYINDCYMGMADENKISSIYPQNSMAHFFRMMNAFGPDDQKVTKKIIKNIVDKIYLPKLKFIDYEYNENTNTITLYTHAPVGLGVIQDLANYFCVEYDDSTPQTLMASIDRINACRPKNEIDLKDLNKNAAFNRLIWERYTDKQMPIEQDMLAKMNGYNIVYVHGHHYSEDHLRDHIKQTDDLVGKISYPEKDARNYQMIDENSHHQYVSTRPRHIQLQSDLGLFSSSPSTVTPSSNGDKLLH